MSIDLEGIRSHIDDSWAADVVDRLVDFIAIPNMAMLGDRFPEAQFLITGVLGPGSNAHGPNEFLHLPMARGVAASVAHVLDAHTRR